MNGDVWGISVEKLLSMMNKLGLKLGRGQFTDLMAKCNPKQTHLICPEEFAMFLLDHVLIFNDQQVSIKIYFQYALYKITVLVLDINHVTQQPLISYC